MAKDKDQLPKQPTAAAVESGDTLSQDAPAPTSSAAAITPVTADKPAPPQPHPQSVDYAAKIVAEIPEQMASLIAQYGIDVAVAVVLASIRAIGAKLSLPQRTAIIEALNAHLQPPSAPPSPYDGIRNFRFRVSWGNREPAEIIAKHPNEAWAAVCDGWKQWPSPKAGKVECLGEAAA